MTISRITLLRIELTQARSDALSAIIEANRQIEIVKDLTEKIEKMEEELKELEKNV